MISMRPRLNKLQCYNFPIEFLIQFKKVSAMIVYFHFILFDKNVSLTPSSRNSEVKTVYNANTSLWRTPVRRSRIQSDSDKVSHTYCRKTDGLVQSNIFFTKTFQYLDNVRVNFWLMMVHNQKCFIQNFQM